VLPFRQVDVFTAEFTTGNPVAVVHDADRLTDDEMARFANWTNLSETTFLLTPSDRAADYRVRIFTTARELPFAGHPTLGSARAWLAAGGVPRTNDEIVQQCGAGLVRIRRDGERLAFAAPPLVRSGTVDPADVAEITRALRLHRDDVVDAQWCQNGPEWVALLLRDADTVLRVDPDYAAFGRFRDIGIAGRHPQGSEADLEVRAFISEGHTEDPVTGSLNAALAQWLIPAGIMPATYLAAQGTALGRRGRILVQHDGADVWIGGHTVIGITGRVAL
jgi:PhzF family phenazine biosynthesis protein